MRDWMQVGGARAVGFFAVMLAMSWLGFLDTRALGQDLVAKTEALTPEQELAKFRVPDGFEVQLVASEPMINKPMNIAFDDRGRLWVTSTIEYPYPAKEGVVPRDSVKILEDFGPDGRARKMTVYADKMNIPIGVLPIDWEKAALVHGIPSIFRMVDGNGDNVADQRSVAYATYGFRDTHGMTSAFHIGFDGWIYACHGFANTSEIKGSDGQVLVLNSGNVYRLKLDGSHVEQITHGQVNPFGLSFDSLGNLFSADCHSQPLYLVMRDAYYPSFGKPHDGLGFCPEITTNDHGSTGIAGVVIYEADLFPDSWKGTAFIGNPVTSRINHDHFEWHGSTPKVIRQPDFLVSDDPWFRPVDVRLGPDGALYVADFYNRIIGHYEVPLEHPGRDRERGRIWRIVPKAKKVQAPRSDWTQASTQDLITDLQHPNLEVRLKASNQLVHRVGASCIPAVKTLANSDQSPALGQAQALWVLQRLNSLTDEELVKAAGRDAREVRVHAMRIVADRSTLSNSVQVATIASLKDQDTMVRRAAVEAVARHPNPDHIVPLLTAWKAAPSDDELLIHAIKISLRNQLNNAAHWSKIAELKLQSEDADRIVLAALGTTIPEAADYLLSQGSRNDDALRHVARYGKPESIKQLANSIKANPSSNLADLARILRAVHRGFQERGTPFDADLLALAEITTRELLGKDEDILVKSGTELAESLKLKSTVKDLIKFGLDLKGKAHRRAWALAAGAAIDPGSLTAPLGQVVGNRAEFSGLRNHMAQVLGTIRNPQAQDLLLGALPDAPSELQKIIAIGLAADKTGAVKLLDLLSSGKVSRSVLQERGLEVRLRASGAPDAEKRLAELLKDMPSIDQKIQRLINRRRGAVEGLGTGNNADLIATGRTIFEKNCAACHQVQGKGAKVGPQLDGIGVRGLDRILEDVVDSNRNVDQSFRTTSLELENGQVLSGLLLREEGKVLVIADSTGKEIRVDSAQVTQRKLANISPMPADFGDKIPEADFARLIFFLLSLSEKPSNPQK